MLVLISFAAGIVARTAVGRRITKWSERSLLNRFPQYQLMKSVAEGLAHIEGATGLKPALVYMKDGWQIGYLIEQLENDWVAVFLPQAPTPRSGNIMYLPANRVRPLGMTMVQAVSIVKAIGVGPARLFAASTSDCRAQIIESNEPRSVWGIIRRRTVTNMERCVFLAEGGAVRGGSTVEFLMRRCAFGYVPKMRTLVT